MEEFFLRPNSLVISTINSKTNAGKEGFGKNASGNMAFEMMSDNITHMDYLHYNPVDYGYVEQVKVWPCSTFHQLV